MDVESRMAFTAILIALGESETPALRDAATDIAGRLVNDGLLVRGTVGWGDDIWVRREFADIFYDWTSQGEAAR